MITAKTIQQAAYEQLGNAVADQKDGNGGLDLDTAGMQGLAHLWHGWKIYINRKAG